MKVFSKEKYLEDMGGEKTEYYKIIMEKCEGKTTGEMFAMGYSTHDDWMVKKETTQF